MNEDKWNDFLYDQHEERMNDSEDVEEDFETYDVGVIVNVFKKFEELDEKMNEVSKKIKDIEMFLKVRLRAHELNFHYDVDSENTLIFKDRIYYMGEGYAHPTPLIECKFHVRNKMVNHLEPFAEALYVFITGNNE